MFLFKRIQKKNKEEYEKKKKYNISCEIRTYLVIYLQASALDRSATLTVSVIS